jgi:hypothetical protein
MSQKLDFHLQGLLVSALLLSNFDQDHQDSIIHIKLNQAIFDIHRRILNLICLRYGLLKTIYKF